jgi:sugar-phosphatase
MSSLTIPTSAILFDMDGTLVDSTIVVERVWRRYADRHGLDVNAILATSHGRLMRETVARWAPDGVDIEAECDDLSAFELVQQDGMYAVPGAAAFANAIPRDAVALVTSAPLGLATMRLTAAGISLPHVMVTAEDVERGKPHPDPYLRGAELLGVAPKDAVVFEDAEAGIESALAAGMRCIVVGPVTGPITEGLPRIADYSQITATVVEVDGQTRILLEL